MGLEILSDVIREIRDEELAAAWTCAACGRKGLLRFWSSLFALGPEPFRQLILRQHSLISRRYGGVTCLEAGKRLRTAQPRRTGVVQPRLVNRDGTWVENEAENASRERSEQKP